MPGFDPEIIRVNVQIAPSGHPPCLRRGLLSAIESANPAAAEGTFVLQVTGESDEAGLEAVTLHCASLAIRGCPAQLKGVATYPTHDHATLDSTQIDKLPCVFQRPV